MRIIAGKFRGRRLLSSSPAIRPTSDRAREALFSIINSLDRNLIQDAAILDAFAGSGALGLEALSRGAAYAAFLEKNRQAGQILKENIANLDVSSQCAIIIRDATTPPQAPRPMQAVFLDPPYDLKAEASCLPALYNQGWINPQTLIVLETSAKRSLSLPPGARLIDQRRYGAALLSFLAYSQDD